MKCRRCRESAVIKMPRHNTAFCPSCFHIYFYQQVEKAISSGGMFQEEERVLVAVSGGKDSLVLWDVLIHLGYAAVGLHLNLGIDRYSETSQMKVIDFARSRNLELIIQDYKEDDGLGVLEVARASRRPPCSACGTMKRHHFNRIAMDKGFNVLATGHNLDDEAARLFGNLLSWQIPYLEKQTPILSDDGGKWAKKVKPLYRLPEREIAAYAVLNNIDYIIEECPMSKGAKTFLYKKMLNQIEEKSPGTKHQFYFGFLKQRTSIFPSHAEKDMRTCSVCHQPCGGEVCSYCRLLKKVAL